MALPLRRSLLFCVCFLYACQYLRTDSSDDEALIVIGILSAQNNSDARYSIRHTWKSLVPSFNSKFYFLIGRHFCPIHPIDRLSEHTCEELVIRWPMGLPYNHRLWTSVMEDLSLKQPQKHIITLFTFRVNFPVILRGMRVMRRLLKILDGAVALLKNAQSGDVVTSLQFDPILMKTSNKDDSWEEKSTQPFLLPKNFDGEFQLLFPHDENNTKSIDFQCVISSSWFDVFGAIKYTALYDIFSGWIPVSNKSCIPMSLQFELHDFQNYQSQKDVRGQLWNNNIRKLSENLKYEAKMENDILFLDVIDVYGSLPNKLLEFFKWTVENLKFHFILKADDDSFVNIPVVWKYLHHVTHSEKELLVQTYLWWWGNLRYGLPVARHGKWQELYYKAPVYPPFPCGGGYILHQNVVKFLVTNLNWLHPFQGEDTSLGIWLSGLNLYQPDSASCKWACAKDCESTQCNRIQLSIQEMYSVWKLYQQAQSICQDSLRSP